MRDDHLAELVALKHIGCTLVHATGKLVGVHTQHLASVNRSENAIEAEVYRVRSAGDSLCIIWMQMRLKALPVLHSIGWVRLLSARKALLDEGTGGIQKTQHAQLVVLNLRWRWLLLFGVLVSSAEALWTSLDVFTPPVQSYHLLVLGRTHRDRNGVSADVLHRLTGCLVCVGALWSLAAELPTTSRRRAESLSAGLCGLYCWLRHERPAGSLDHTAEKVLGPG